MDTEIFSISPLDLSTRLARADAPLVLDVRRNIRYAESDRVLPRAQPTREVVVYCVHGLEVGKQAAAELRAQGWDAKFLEGGIEGWQAAGLPTVPKDVGA